MSKKKLTPWFDGDVKPVRPGIYERNYHSAFIEPKDYWDGQKWMLSFNGTTASDIISGIRLPWRGLARRPR